MTWGSSRHHHMFYFSPHPAPTCSTRLPKQLSRFNWRPDEHQMNDVALQPRQILEVGPCQNKHSGELNGDGSTECHTCPPELKVRTQAYIKQLGWYV